MKEKKKWTRKCLNPNNNSKCKQELTYFYERSFKLAIKRNSLCSSCTKYNKNNPMYGKSIYDIWTEQYGTEEAECRRIKMIKKQSKAKKDIYIGKNNPMYGKCAYDIWLEKYGKNEANKRQKISNEKGGESRSGKNHPLYNKKRSDEVKQKISKNLVGRFTGKNNPMYGRSVYSVWLEKYGKKEADVRQKKLSKNNPSKRSEVREKQRVSAIKRIKEKHGQCMPNYNSEGCKIIDNYGEKHGYNFQHAENGGEVCIGGYYPDGLDEERKTIIEIDERHHFNFDGTLKKKDIERQQYLEKLGYEIIRINYEIIKNK